MCKFLNGRLLQYVAAATATLHATIMGMATLWTSPVIPQLMSDHSPIGVKITLTDLSPIVSSLILGYIVSSLFLGIIFDAIGLKLSMLLPAIPIAISWIMIGFARSVITLCAARFILGFSASIAFTACTLYLAEIAEPQIRGRLSIIGVTMLETGSILAVLVGSYGTYKLLALVSFLVPVLFLVIFYFIPDTPYYYLKRGKTEEAREILRKFRGSENVEKELKKIENNIKESKQNTARLGNLFTNKKHRKNLLIVMGTKTLLQLSGTVAIQQYMQLIFDETSSGLDSTTSTVISVFVPLPAIFIASPLVDKVGRKPLYYASIIGCMAALLCEATYFKLQKAGADMDSLAWLPLTGIFLFSLAKTLGIYNFPFLLLSELFPPNVKGYAASFIMLYNSCLLFSVTYCFPLFSEYFGIDVQFLTFAVCLAFGLIFVILCVPETKGKSLEEIQLGNK